MNRGIAPILAIILLVVFLLAANSIGGMLWVLMINSLIGLLIIVIINFLPQIEIPVNIWTLLIAGIGGIPGILLLVILDLLKVDLN